MSFSENELKRAAKAVDQAMLDNLPPPETPSPLLLEKLEGLPVQPARKPKWKTVLPRVAACVIVFFAVGCCWLASDVDARAALLQWIRDFTQDHYGYYFSEMESHGELPEYDFGWMPSGWEKSPFGDTESTHHRFVYSNHSEGRSINLLYFLPTAAAALIFHFKNRQICKKAILPAAVGGCIAAVLGAMLASAAEPDLLRKLFGGFLVLVGLSELFKKVK